MSVPCHVKSEIWKRGGIQGDHLTKGEKKKRKEKKKKKYKIKLTP